MFEMVGDSSAKVYDVFKIIFTNENKKKMFVVPWSVEYPINVISLGQTRDYGDFGPNYLCLLV